MQKRKSQIWIYPEMLQKSSKNKSSYCRSGTICNLHFYSSFVDICLKETMSLADSLYNLQLIQEFCQEYLNQCCHFSLEDMLYAASSVKVKKIKNKKFNT